MEDSKKSNTFEDYFLEVIKARKLNDYDIKLFRKLHEIKAFTDPQKCEFLRIYLLYQNSCKAVFTSSNDRDIVKQFFSPPIQVRIINFGAFLFSKQHKIVRVIIEHL